MTLVEAIREACAMPILELPSVRICREHSSTPIIAVTTVVDIEGASALAICEDEDHKKEGVRIYIDDLLSNDWLVTKNIKFEEGK